MGTTGTAVTAKRRVVTVDDTLRRTRTMVVGGRLAFARDRQGRKVQDVVCVDKTLEGAHLEHALRRARRWLRRPRGRAPNHIALSLMALRRVDPAGFERALKEVGER